MAEKKVKIRLFSYLVEGEDPFRPGEKRLVQRYASHDQTITTDDEPDEPDPDVAYGLRDYDLRRGEHLGAFYTDEELEAMEAEEAPAEEEAVNPPIAPQTKTETVQAQSPAEMSVEQLATWIEQEEPTENELVELASSSQQMAQKVLDAETLATGGEPREGVQLGVAQLLGADVAREIDATDEAKQLAAEHGIELATIEGTGKDGRILKADVEQLI